MNSEKFSKFSMTVTLKVVKCSFKVIPVKNLDVMNVLQHRSGPDYHSIFSLYFNHMKLQSFLKVLINQLALSMLLKYCFNCNTYCKCTPHNISGRSQVH